MKRIILLIALTIYFAGISNAKTNTDTLDNDKYLSTSFRVFFVDSITIPDAVIVEYRSVKYVVSQSDLRDGLKNISFRPGFAFVYRDDPYADVPCGMKALVPDNNYFESPDYKFREKRGGYKIYEFSEPVSEFIIAVVQTNWLNHLLSGNGEYHQFLNRGAEQDVFTAVAYPYRKNSQISAKDSVITMSDIRVCDLICNNSSKPIYPIVGNGMW